MRYAQRGGYTPAEQQRRERLRLEAAERFACGDDIEEIAQGMDISEEDQDAFVEQWKGTEQASIDAVSRHHVV